MARSLAPDRLAGAMTTDRKHALVVGGLGVIGRNLIEHLDPVEDWDVTAVSRRAPEFDSSARFISADLLDRPAATESLGRLDDVTHLFYAAYQARPTRLEEVEPNLTMLRNAVEVVEAASPGLRHVTLMQGGKAYGCHLGPFKTPAKESDPRHMPPNFYYDQEDFLREHEPAASWTWTALRPEAVCGFAVGNPMNLAMVIAVYASISKELGLPFRFPGKPGAYEALYQVTAADLLARATVWAAEEPRCRNEVLNITNGDYFRWKNLWPVFARFFDMDLADPQTISLTETMTGQDAVWDEIVSRHGLQPYPYSEVAHWGFGDVVFGMTWDNISSTLKARSLGFHDFVDTEEMFLTLFAKLRANKVIP